MKKFFKIISLALAVASLCLAVCSCGVDKKDPEIVDAAKALMEKSYALNDIYFGKGLPVSAEDSEEAQKFAADNGFDLQNIQFLPVTPDSPYKSIEDMKNATLKVYSEDYCEYLFSMAFEGYSTEDGTAAIYAKYMEDEAGTLTARIDLAKNSLPKRTYDYDSIEVKSKSEDMAVFSVDSYLDGKKEDKRVEFTLVFGEDGWRLDTPTY